MSDLGGAALIREVHVWTIIAGRRGNKVRYSIQDWEHVCSKRPRQLQRRVDLNEWTVISAVGTRGYYLDRGFERGELYLTKT